MPWGIILHAALGVIQIFIKNPEHATEYAVVTKHLGDALDELGEVQKKYPPAPQK